VFDLPSRMATWEGLRIFRTRRAAPSQVGAVIRGRALAPSAVAARGLFEPRPLCSIDRGLAAQSAILSG
jgi:hypothetical protein